MTLNEASLLYLFTEYPILSDPIAIIFLIINFLKNFSNINCVISRGMFINLIKINIKLITLIYKLL